MQILFRAFLILSCLIILPAPHADAALRVDITKGVVEPIPVAITKMGGSDATSAKVGQDISKVVAQDLERSGLFKAIDHKRTCCPAFSGLARD
jgi:TolB protein